MRHSSISASLWTRPTLIWILWYVSEFRNALQYKFIILSHHETHWCTPVKYPFSGAEFLVWGQMKFSGLSIHLVVLYAWKLQYGWDWPLTIVRWSSGVYRTSMCVRASMRGLELLCTAVTSLALTILLILKPCTHGQVFLDNFFSPSLTPRLARV